MDSLFSYICFSLDICIKFDPFLHLTPLGATSISAMPQHQVSKRKDPPLYTYTSRLSLRPWVFFTLKDIRRNSLKISLSLQLDNTWGKNEATVTVLEGMLGIFQKPPLAQSSAVSRGGYGLLICWPLQCIYGVQQLQSGNQPMQ